MFLAALVAVVIGVVASQGHGNHNHHGHQDAFMNHAKHMYEHVLDTNKDGMVTIFEELSFFQQRDPNHDCKETYDDFKSSRALHSFHLTEEQLQTLFKFYDTRGGTQAADGFYTCDDVQYFFGRVDADGDGYIREPEFLQSLGHLTDALAQMVPAGATPKPTTSAPA